MVWTSDCGPRLIQVNQWAAVPDFQLLLLKSKFCTNTGSKQWGGNNSYIKSHFKHFLMGEYWHKLESRKWPREFKTVNLSRRYPYLVLTSIWLPFKSVKISTKSKLSFLFQRVSVRSEAFPINRNQNTQIKLRRGGVYWHKISPSVLWHNDLSIVYSALFIYFILLLFLPKRSIKNHYSIGSAMPPFWQLTLSGKKYINTLVDGRT